MNTREWAASSIQAPDGAHLVRNRPEVEGKFLRVRGQRLWVKGVTYGTFPPNEQGEPFPEPTGAIRDLRAMAAGGINAIRTYTPAPRWLLNEALRRGIRVMVGLPWEQHVAFLDDEERCRDIRERTRRRVEELAGHPAILAYAVGKEIPASIERWHGRREVERFLERLCRDVRDRDPGALVTYVNLPTTEYLELPFLDFLSFNVYLESRDRLEAYLSRLQNLADERPLIMAVIGLDS
jgi:beta-galactosidase/beta-glucuronidase